MDSNLYKRIVPLHKNTYNFVTAIVERSVSQGTPNRKNVIQEIYQRLLIAADDIAEVVITPCVFIKQAIHKSLDNRIGKEKAGLTNILSQVRKVIPIIVVARGNVQYIHDMLE